MATLKSLLMGMAVYFIAAQVLPIFITGTTSVDTLVTNLVPLGLGIGIAWKAILSIFATK